MKKLLSTMGMATLLLAIACNRPDQKLIEDMKAELDLINNTTQQMQSVQQSIADIQAKSANLVSTKPNDNADPATQTLMMANTLGVKYQAMLAGLSDMKQKLETMLADYSAGKLRKVDVEAEFKTIQNGVEGYPKTLEQISPRITATATKLDEFIADGSLRPAQAGELPAAISVQSGTIGAPPRSDGAGKLRPSPNAAPGAIADPGATKEQQKGKQ